LNAKRLAPIMASATLYSPSYPTARCGGLRGAGGMSTDAKIAAYATTGDWKSEENFLGEPGEIGLAPLEEVRDGIDQDAKGRLAQLAAGLAER
jgi:hypothetical protein